MKPGALATAEAHKAEREIVASYWAAIQAEASQADKDRWADGRHFTFTRLIAHSRELVWAHWIMPDLLAGWWAPPSLKVAKCLIEPEPAGCVVLEFYGSGERHVSRGQVLSAERPKRLIFDLTLLNRAGAAAFTAHYDLALAEPGGDKCQLQLDMTITQTTVEALPFIAGIETGWNRVNRR
ncbi:SRPBCC domain-containing protein [Pelagibacterium sp. H642]|uniref:SRPBCC family protein n=1 Tax=Pelagibacterium sp. H642 TaxID=1881069 RepID=UPI002815F54A|nr:SRPBCC domain-containing protein [Pelagibacterium sp. H642]WMT92714.1 SRPBCC domain-containing protein [Pelagibacterium sp. H642]